MSLATLILIDFLKLFFEILDLYKWLIIIGAILSWLVAFNIINTSNRFIRMVGDFLYRLTEPALRRIRNLVPYIGGMDLSPLILIFLIWFLEAIIQDIIYKLAV